MKLYQYKIIIFWMLLWVWVLFACGSLLVNGAKVVLEERTWISLSEDEKREKIFGDLHPFFQFVTMYSEKDAKILIFSNHVMTQYLGMYYLYPRMITVTDDVKAFTKLVQTKKYMYVVVYNANISPKEYANTAEYSGKDANHFGSFFKRR